MTKLDDAAQKAIDRLYAECDLAFANEVATPILDALCRTANSSDVKVKGLTLDALQRAHVERQEEWCPDQKPDLSFRGNEMAGEVGEACNVIKKLERERQGWRGSRATKEQLAEELADVIHTAVLCAITAGIDIEPATVAKFNATSEKNGLMCRLSALAPAEAGVEGGAKPVAWVRQSSLDALETETIGFEGVHTLLSAGKSKWCTVPLYTSAPLAEADRGALEALGPFTAFAEHAVERLEDGIHAGGWVWRTSGNERISDWFGPSDFGSLLYFAAALTHPSLLEEFEALGISRKFQHGDRVTKIKGSSWTGRVVGFYSTSLTPNGYAVESENEPSSVQIYPETALRPSSPGEKR